MSKTDESNEIMSSDESSRIILYTTDDGRSQVSLMSRDGRIWLNQKQMAELFAVSKPNISMLISKIFSEKELDDSVVKLYLTTALEASLQDCVFAYGLLWDIACATGVLNPSQKAALRRVCRYLGLHENYFVLTLRRRLATVREVTADEACSRVASFPDQFNCRVWRREMIRCPAEVALTMASEGWKS